MFRGLMGPLAVWSVGAVMLRATVAAPHVCPDINVAGLRTAEQAAATWFATNQHDDGTWLYEYNADTDEVIDDYNEVRHAGVMMSLYQLAAHDPARASAVLPVADRGLGWLEANLIRYEDWAAARNPRTGSVKLGTTSLMLAGLANRRLATGDTRHDSLMHELARFILVMQREDGAFLNYWLLSTQAPDPTITSRYATGEAFWALTLMRDAFPDGGWDEPARAVADYLSLYRDEAEGLDFPPWADQWAAYGLSEMGDWEPGLNDDNIRYARSLAERFGFLMRIESQRDGSFLVDFVHGDQTRAAGMGTWVEGLTSMWRLSTLDERMADMEPDLADRAICGAALLAGRQLDATEAQEYDEPAMVEGAWLHEGITRMDDQQHALSGIMRTEAILQREAED